ncbi:MAG: hypothetical protein H0X40_03880 [Chthoniobacterales bacterium]|nr:hypothetical protein [Chthoniobacterales bacterium]
MNSLSRLTLIVRLISFVLLLAARPIASQAVILYRTADPTANTTAPSGMLANSGWQYEGIWGSFLGTPIAPHFFLSAKHVGQAGGSTFVFGGNNYSIVRQFADPNTDLDLWQVTETFPTFAPLYTKSDEVGKLTLVIGRGTQRGTDRLVNNMLAGWNWGAGDGVERWGENVVSQISTLTPDNDFIYATFDAPGLTEEATLSSGDSGGAAFIEDGSVWKLAGIHYAVDGPFYTDSSGNGAFNGALFDTRGLYNSDDGKPPYILITGNAPVPSGFYPTRISSKLGWIYSVTDSLGDLDADGLANLLEYALHTNPLAADTTSLPKVALESGFLTLTYTKVTTATDIQYSVEQSSDLTNWTTSNPTNEVVATQNNVQTIKAKVALNGATRLFLRLRVTRP